MKQRVTYLLKTYLLTVLIFITAKVVFMLCHADDHPFQASDVLSVITHGLSLDLSTALYLLIVPFLLAVISLYGHRQQVLVRILSAYHLVIAVTLALAFVADTSLYNFWQFKLDASCLQYLETPTEAMASVSWGYMAVRLVVFLMLAFLFFKAYQAVARPLRSASPLPKGFKSAACGLVFFLLLLPVFIIGIRGGLDESTTNVGQVYFSQDQFLNHAAVNPVFSFLSSFEKTASNIVDYDFFSEEECRQLTHDLYPTTSEAPDTLLNTTRPHIVIVLMESAGDFLTKAMPNLTQLKEEGIDFTNCYGNTWRTDRGTVCTYSGYPSFPTSSVMKMPKKSSLLPGIALTLRQQGYHTSYLYGGDINFTNMRSYLIGTGWEQLKWKADYTAEEQTTSKWGVRDGITFNTLYEQICAIDTTASANYLFGFSTLSSHEPWDVPVSKFDDEVVNAFYYLDLCIGEFINKLKATPQWQNLLVIFLPDHSIDHEAMVESHPLRNKIPMVWVGGAVRQPRKVTQICNQTDLVATLLSQMQLPHDQFRWSRDVLSRSYRYPFAVHNYNNGFSMIDSTGFIAYDLDASRFVTNESSDAARLERIGKAILQATTADLKAMGTK